MKKTIFLSWFQRFKIFKKGYDKLFILTFQHVLEMSGILNRNRLFDIFRANQKISWKAQKHEQILKGL